MAGSIVLTLTLDLGVPRDKMPVTFDEKERRIALWRGRMAEAKARYETAALHLKGVEKESMPSADANFAFQQALREENTARRQYVKVLKIFSDLLGGKIPEEKEWAE
jgi:hypothetical protein